MLTLLLAVYLVGVLLTLWKLQAFFPFKVAIAACWPVCAAAVLLFLAQDLHWISTDGQP